MGTEQIVVDLDHPQSEMLSFSQRLPRPFTAQKNGMSLALFP